MQLFLDLDGVLADFDAHHAAVFGRRPDKTKDDVDWDAVRRVPHFYRDLPPTPDMWELWNGTRHLQPIVLTGVPRLMADEATANKCEWVWRYLGPDVQVVCCRSRDKCLHGRPGDVLVDDWTKYQSLWERMGGTFVVHASSLDSLRQLRALGLPVLGMGVLR